MEKRNCDERHPRDRRFKEERVEKHMRMRFEDERERHFDERPMRPHKPERPRMPKRPERGPYVDPRKPHPRPRPKMKTKLFTSKEELVTFVNEKGEEGHRIDVYKIEDDLYKVVVMENPRHKKVEVEIDLEEE